MLHSANIKTVRASCQRVALLAHHVYVKTIGMVQFGQPEKHLKSFIMYDQNAGVLFGQKISREIDS